MPKNAQDRGKRLVTRINVPQPEDAKPQPAQPTAASPNAPQVKVERYVAPEPTRLDIETETLEPKLRPAYFTDYPGQDRIVDNLKTYVAAACGRGQALDHVLLHGPPGLGKTTLAHIIANELGVPFYHASGPAIDKPGDLAGILAGMEPRALLFIDEIHRMPITVEEVLYAAMEDFCIDVVIGQGPTARSLRMPLQPFTLVGATTRVALLSRPLLSRFGIQERLEFYDDAALVQILERSAKIWNVGLTREGAFELARRSRGTPRVANRLLRRVRDFADVYGESSVGKDTVNLSLSKLDIDQRGLERMDRAILQAIHERYEGGPVGLDTLAATVGEDRATIEDVYEPFLVHQGLLARGPRGRYLTPQGRSHIAGT